MNIRTPIPVWQRVLLAAFLAALPCLSPLSAEDADEEAAKARAKALRAGMTGELLENGDFSQWNGERPVGWGIWNPMKGCKVKAGPVGPSGAPALEMVPDDAGFIDLTARVHAAAGILQPGDSLLMTLTLKADQGVPMEILLTVAHGPEGGEKEASKLPFKGDGEWNTIQYTLPALPPDLDRVELAVRIRGAKEGTAYLGRASLRVLPPVL